MTGALLALLVAADPCGPVVRTASQPKAAAAYAKVAGEELLRGAREAAVIAWRRSAELSAPGSPAEATLAQLCAMDRARAAAEENDCVRVLSVVGAAVDGPESSEARALRTACESGSAREALLRLRGPADVARRTERRDRLTADLSAEAGWDSNATSSPTGGADDGVAVGLGVLTFRPLGADGPFAIAGGGYRKQLIHGASDVGLATATVGWDQGLGPARVSLDYGLDYVALGGAPFLLRNRVTLLASVALGQARLSAEYAVRHELVFPDVARDDTGLRHAGELAGAVVLGPLAIELAGVASRGAGVTADRSYVEAGGELRAGFHRGSLSVDALVGARWRGYDAVDPDFAVLRKETQVELRLEADWAFDAVFAVFVAGEGRWVASSVPALSYPRAGLSAGLRVKVGLW